MFEEVCWRALGKGPSLLKEGDDLRLTRVFPKLGIGPPAKGLFEKKTGGNGYLLQVVFLCLKGWGRRGDALTQNRPRVCGEISKMMA